MCFRLTTHKACRISHSARTALLVAKTMKGNRGPAGQAQNQLAGPVSRPERNQERDSEIDVTRNTPSDLDDDGLPVARVVNDRRAVNVAPVATT